MALNGFGLNAAVQAFPQMYEFGRSLFGQDNASKAQAFKEKQAEIELALKQREMDDNAAYRQGVLAAQNYSNETQRMGTENTYKIGDRETRVRESLAPSQIQQNIASSGLAGAQTNRINTLTPVEVQEGQARVGQIGAQTNRINTMTPWEVQEAKSRIALQGAQTGLTGVQATAARDANNRANQNQPYHIRGLAADADKAEAEARWTKDIDQDQEKQRIYRADPFDRRLTPEDQDRVRVMRSIQFNPHAAEAVQAFDEAANLYASGQAKAEEAFNPKVVEAVGRGIQPLLDLNKNFKAGQLRFNGFEPAEGGVRVRLLKPTEDGRLEPTYLTDGRGNVSDGATPKVFTGQELHQMLGGLRGIAEAQANDPEYAAEEQDWELARSLSRNRVEFAHNFDEIRNRRLRNQLAAENKAEADADRAERIANKTMIMRDGITKDALDELDRSHPISQLRPEEGKPTPQYQQLMQARSRLDAALRGAVADAEPEELRRAHATDLFNIPEVAEALTRYRDAYNRYQPPVDGEQAPAEVKPRAGVFSNPRYPQSYTPEAQSQSSYRPQGGGAAPLAQAAPDPGGILKSHLAAGKSAEHLTGMRGPFAERLAAMLQDAPGPVSIYSGYRSPQRQAQIFAGSDHSGHRVAHPGHSNHNHGIAADLKFASPAVKRWVHQNAARYGLAFRMPWEPWHIEPAGAGPDARNWGI